jgi:hypothetical protein
MQARYQLLHAHVLAGKVIGGDAAVDGGQVLAVRVSAPLREVVYYAVLASVLGCLPYW